MRGADAEVIRIGSETGLVRSLERLGVPRQEAEARVAAMTDEERATLSAGIESMPAGGNLGYEIVFAATGIAIVAGLIALVWILVKSSRESPGAAGGE